MTDVPTPTQKAAPVQSLRSLMTGLPDVPPFRLLLAPGWEQHVVSAQTASALSARVSERIRHLGRPDIDASMSAQLRRSFAAMQRAGSRIVYLPASVHEDALVPMSMVASVIKGENGQSLDPTVAQFFREKGAEFFDTLKSTVRWTTETRGTGDAAGSVNHTVNYIIAVPESGRRRAILFTATVLQSVEDPLEPQQLDGFIALSDAMLSTFAWVSPTAAVTHGVGTSTH